MITSNSNKRSFEQLPDKCLLETFIEASTWLPQHRHVLESLRTNYRNNSPLFQSVVKEVSELSLSFYNPVLLIENCLTKHEDSSSHDIRDDNDETFKPSDHIKSPFVTNDNLSLKGAKNIIDWNFSMSHNIARKKRVPVLEVEPDPRPQNPKPEKVTDTMHAVEYSTKYILDIARNRELNLSHLSLRKPPETSVSMVKVLARVTNIHMGENKSLHSTPKKFSIKSLIHGTEKLKRFEKTPSIRTLERTYTDSGSHHRSTGEGKNGNTAGAFTFNGEFQHETWNKNKKTSRRKSVMGRNLPLYIYEQINSGRSCSEESPISGDPQREPGTKDKISGKDKKNFEIPQVDKSVDDLSKNIKNSENFQPTSTALKLPFMERTSDMRINNLLENSQYLYHQTQKTYHDSGNGNNSISESGHVDSAISDGDKEYISPFMFTRSLEDFDVNITYGNFGDESQDEEAFNPSKIGLEDAQESDGEENIANDYESRDMKLYR